MVQFKEVTHELQLKDTQYFQDQLPPISLWSLDSSSVNFFLFCIMQLFFKSPIHLLPSI